MNLSASNNRRAYRSSAPLLAMLAGLSAAALGCGDGRPTRIPIEGQVLIDGKPLAFGQILFHSKEHRPATSRIDSEGRFRLSTYEKGDGCVAGAHQVTVNAGENLSSTARRWHAPKKYAEISSSGLVVEVNNNAEPVRIDLTWSGGKAFVEKLEGGGD